MSFLRSKLHAFASKSSSVSAGRFAMGGSKSVQVDPATKDHHFSSVTPYVALRGRLSQAWINRWTILLFLVLVRTLMAIATLQKDINSARREALAACTAVESMGSAMASMPHYLSAGVNKMTADGVNHAVNGLMTMLGLSVTAIEDIAVFIINTLYGTYLCLITLAVSGSLHAAIALIEDAQKFIDSALQTIAKDLNSGINSFDSALNTALKDIQSAAGFFGANINIPKLNLNPQINQLNNLQLPPGLDSQLNALNKSIPTFTQVEGFVDNIIRLPFEEIKKLMNNALPNYHFDSSVFPVPQKTALTFCSHNNDINNFFNQLSSLGHTAKKIAIGVLVSLAVLAIIPMAWREVKRWRMLEKRAKMIEDHHTDPLDVVYIASRPYTAGAGLTTSARVGSNRRRALIRWAVAYATTTPALFVLSLGIAGLFSCLCQYVLLRAIQKEVPQLVNQVGQFAGQVVNALNNASESWATATNGEILRINGQINHDVFGWVNTSTTTLNDTLNAFVESTTDVLNSTFGGTILYQPIQGVFNCLIGLKITGIEKALTWAHNHAHINFPLLPSNTFSLGAAASIGGNHQTAGFLTNPATGATDQVTEAIDRLVNDFLAVIINETIVSGSLVALWLLIVLIGVLRAITLAFGREIPANGADRLVNDDSQRGITPPDEKYQSNGEAAPMKPPPVPSHTTPTSNGKPSNSGNQYKGSSYTIDPRPFPQFDEKTPAPGNESMGRVGGKNVKGATRTPHQRVSSHGRIEVTSPDLPNARGANSQVTFDRMWN